MRRVFIILILCILCIQPFVLSSEHNTQHAEIKPSEFDVKAAYLYQFLKFMQWPQSVFTDSLQPIVIGIVGETPFNQALNELVEERTIFSRPIIIQSYREDQDKFDCHVLYISAIEKRFQVAILNKLKNSNIFTIGDAENFIDIGGMIGFISHENRLGFNINLKEIKRAKLVISGKILRLALSVEQ